MITRFDNAKRESVQLWIAIGIILVLSAYRLTAEMLPQLQSFFATYTQLPIAMLLLNGLFFWLLGLLWIAYRRWHEALHAQQELEHVLMSISPDALVVVNRDREITMCSGQVEAMFGFKSKELIGKKTDILYLDRRLRGEKGEISNRLEKYGFHIGYATGKRRDGGTFPLEIITGTIRFQQGAVVLMRDITERCNIEDALRHSEARFDLFMRYLPGFAFIKDAEGRRVFLNPNYERALGWKISDCLGKTDVELHGPEIAQQFAMTDAEVLNESKVVRYTTRIHQKNCDLSLLTVKFPIPSSDRSAPLIGGLALDITEQELAERERLNIERQMQQTQKLESLGVLAGGIAHDFNNLLMGMLGHADLALHQVADPSIVRRHIEEVVSSVQRAAELANQLLAYSGEGKYQLEVIDVSDMVEELSTLLKVSVAKKAALHVNLGTSLPPVECDPTQIRQVLMNVIVNASDALENHAGLIKVETGKATLSLQDFNNTFTAGGAAPECGDYVYVRVTDTGSGMDEQTLARIFDPFFTTKFAGHGLGLAAALGIIRSHHGTISIDSTPGKGTVFTVYLPVTDKTINVKNKQNLLPANWKGEGRVLLVDDEETVREVASVMLQSIGFDVILAQNGAEAVDIAMRERDNLCAILLDLTMPEMGGLEAFLAIRKFAESIPVIISSGYNKQESLDIPNDVMKPHFLKKPYRLSVIRDVFNQALPGKQA